VIRSPAAGIDLLTGAFDLSSSVISGETSRCKKSGCSMSRRNGALGLTGFHMQATKNEGVTWRDIINAGEGVMIKLTMSCLLYLIANAIGLLVAAFVLPGFQIDPLAFVVAVVVFSLVEGVLGPLITKISFQYLPK